MGKIKRQGLGVSAFLYLGLVFGFINTGLLFPKILPGEVYGYAQFLAKVSGLLTVISLLGLPILTVRYFPKLRNKAHKHDGYFMGLMLTGLFLTAIVASFLLLFQDAVIAFFQQGDQENTLIREFYWGIVAWFVINNVLIMLSSYATALQRPRVPVFFLEIGGRIRSGCLYPVLCGEAKRSRGRYCLFSNGHWRIPLVFFHQIHPTCTVAGMGDLQCILFFYPIG